MKIRILVLALLCQGIHSSGQVTIKGKVRDRQQNVLFATVQLLRPDSSLVKTVMTISSGEFVFEGVGPGRYLVASSVVGYSRFLSPAIFVAGENVILPDIVLGEITAELGGVLVKTKKPLFEQQIDRLVVNVQSNITASGSSVLDVLQKTPGIVVNRQNNTIAMNGKTGVRVMINGKLMELPFDVVVQMLDGMSASNVEKIELITAPPAKYDAEGNAGIIHIILKGNADRGTNGSIGITAGFRWAEQTGGNFSLNHRDKKTAFFLDYSISRNHNLHLFRMSRQSPDAGFTRTASDFSHRENVTTQQNLNSGFEWKISSKTVFNLALTGYRRNWDLTALAYDNYQATKDSTLFTQMNIRELNIWQSGTAGIGLQTKTNSKSGVDLNLDYLYYHNSNPSDYVNNLFYEQGNSYNTSKTDLKKNTPIHFIIATADCHYNFSPSFLVEAGIKKVTSRLTNNVLVQRFENNVWTIDPVFTSYSNLKEEVDAAYVSAKWQTHQRWQVNGGLRYEYTHTSIGTPKQKDIINRKYNYLFPTISIKKDFNNNEDLQISYSKRITRPTYNDLAPFVFFWGPNTFSSGNTALLSAISDAIRTGYHLKRWIVSFQFSHSRNDINFLQPELDSLSNLIYRPQNLKYLNTMALTNTRSFNIARWWEVQANLVVQYQMAKTMNLPNNVGLHLYGINVNITHSLRLPNDFSIEVSGIYHSKMLSGISDYLPSGSVNAGVQKKFRSAWTIRLALDDAFNTDKWRIKTSVPQNNLYSYFDYDFHTRFVRVTLTRNFGDSKLNSIKLKSGSEEERARVRN